MKYSLCNDWEFTEAWSEAFCQGAGDATPVRLPHTPKAIPTHYGDHTAYQMVCGYRKTLPIPAYSAV